MRLRHIRLSAVGTLLGMLVIVAGTLSADTGLQHQTFQGRPISLGTSGGSIKDRSMAFCCSGTLGALVTDGTTQYVLSNNHVLARTNKGSVGDDIIQPGLIDQSPACAQDANDAVADLSAWNPISFSRGTTNLIDAAVAQVRSGKVSPEGVILDIGTVSRTLEPAVINMPVQKSGRTTGLTKGVVAAVNVTIDVKYGSPCGGGRGTARFTNQIRITPDSFSAAGDSGSLVVQDLPTNPRPVGLLFAGSASVTFANPIHSVLSAFGVSMVGTTSATNRTPFWKWFAQLLPSPRAAYAEHPAHPSIDPGSQAAATRAKERHEQAMLRVQGVVGLGVGASDVVPGAAVVEVYVEKDTPAVRAAIPTQLDNVPVKVVETGEITARRDSCPLK